MSRHQCDIVVLYNADGLEHVAALESATSIVHALRSRYRIAVAPFQESRWLEAVSKLSEMRSLILMATHGGVGENGTVQKYLESHDIPHTHSAAVACRILMNKHKTKLMYRGLGISTPDWSFGSTVQLAPRELCIAKPVEGGSRLGLMLSRAPTVRPKPDLIYERCVQGCFEVSVSVVGHAEPRPLRPIVRRRNLDSLGTLQPTRFRLPAAVGRRCADTALAVHSSLQCYGVTKTDFVLDDNLEPHAIETDAHPGLGWRRATATAARRVGITYVKLLSLILAEVVS